MINKEFRKFSAVLILFLYFLLCAFQLRLASLERRLVLPKLVKNAEECRYQFSLPIVYFIIFNGPSSLIFVFLNILKEKNLKFDFSGNQSRIDGVEGTVPSVEVVVYDRERKYVCRK